MQRVLTFGELLLRISPDSTGDWLDNNQVPVFPGGAEANVATALARWNIPVSYLTAAPDNFLTRQILSYLNALGIDLSPVVFQGTRLGLYYLSQGKDLKHGEVIYDRENSAFAQLKPGAIDWNKIFDKVGWFHFSAICPALNNSIAEVCMEALQVATAKNIAISLDLNYRAKLWQYGKSPLSVMPSLAQYCNLIMGNIWSIQAMLGIPEAELNFDTSASEACREQARISSQQLVEKFPKCTMVANTFRMQEQEKTRYYATLYKEGILYSSREHIAGKGIHAIGTGDCFMAGLIYGTLKEMPLQQVIEFATAAAFDKFYSSGDGTTSSVGQIENRIS